MENNEVVIDMVENAKLFSSLSDDIINEIVLIVEKWSVLCKDNKIHPEELFQIIEQALDILDSYDAKTDERLIDIKEAVQIAINKVIYGNELDSTQIHIK